MWQIETRQSKTLYMDPTRWIIYRLVQLTRPIIVLCASGLLPKPLSAKL